MKKLDQPLELRQNQTYRAKLENIPSLPVFLIRGKVRGALEDAGFTDVTAWETKDGVWMAQATWPGVNKTVTELPDHVAEVWPV